MKIKLLDVFKENIEKIKGKVKLSTKSGKRVFTPEEVVSEIQENRNHSWYRESFRDNKFADEAIQDLENGISKEEFKKKYADRDYIQFKYFAENAITHLDFLY